MTLKIGRFTTQRDPARIDHDGDRLSFGGMLFATSLVDLEVQRQQLLGLDGNQDEPDVPVTWSRDAGLDGYYTVNSVSVSPIHAVTYNQFKFQYAVQLERVQGGFAAPLCEVSASIAVRTNGHSVTVPLGGFGIPQTSTFNRGAYSVGTAMSQSALRASATGTVILVRTQPSVGSFASYGYAVTPADYYDGAVVVEQLVGSTWYPVVGDQIGAVTGDSLRISNGLVRMVFNASFAFKIEVWDGAVWESETSFQIALGGSNIASSGGWRVLRNSPEACTVQASVSISVAPQRVVTLHLERGSMLVHINVDGLYFVSDIGTVNEAAQLSVSPSAACTSLTGGIRLTSDDANGHRWIMLSASAVTKSVANGSLLIAAPGAALVAQFALGWERDGSTSGGSYDAVAVAEEYFCALGVRQRVVAR